MSKRPRPDASLAWRRTSLPRLAGIAQVRHRLVPAAFDLGRFHLGVGDPLCRPAAIAAELTPTVLPLRSCFLASVSAICAFAAGDGFCFSLAAAFSALPLPSCFLASISAVFDFGDGDGLCKPAAIAVEPAPRSSPLPLSFCFLISVVTGFDFAADDELRKPAAIAVELAPTVSPLSFPSLLPSASCFLPTVAGFFDLSVGNTMSPAVVRAPAPFALRLLSCFWLSSTAILVFGKGDGFCRPVALAPGLAELALLLSSCLLTWSAVLLLSSRSLTSGAAIFGLGCSERIVAPAADAPMPGAFA